MKFSTLAARFALLLSLCLMTVAPAQARSWQCAPYAREISAVKIYGNAHTWWEQAAGRYQRGNTPKPGAILSFKSSRRMRLGHVAMVSKVIGEREVLLTHANWSRRGGIERDVRAIDVSEAGDWSSVRVWYGPIGDLGTSANATNGFIYGDGAPEDTEMDAPVLIAIATPAPAAEALPIPE